MAKGVDGVAGGGHCSLGMEADVSGGEGLCRYAQGHTGLPWQKEWMEWLEEDIAAQGTGAEAAGEAGQPMVVQQAEVGNDPEGKGAGE